MKTYVCIYWGDRIHNPGQHVELIEAESFAEANRKMRTEEQHSIDCYGGKGIFLNPKILGYLVYE